MLSNCWAEINPAVAHYAKLPNSTDVVIIGGGMTGLAAAYILSATMPDISIILLEKNIPGLGHTIGAHGLMSAKIDKRLAKLSPKILSYITSLSRTGLDFVRTIIEKHNIFCNADFSGGLHVALSASEQNYLKKFGKLISENDVKRISLISNKNYGGLPVPDELVLNPFKFCQALAQILLHSGQHIASFSNVIDVISNRDEPVVVLENDHRIKAKHVVYCCGNIPSWITTITNTDYLSRVALYTFISEAIHRQALPTSCQYNNFYVHTINKHVLASQKGKLCSSRLDTSSTNIKNVLRSIRSKVHKDVNFKLQRSQVDHIYEASDGLPIVGKIPGRNHEYLCIGFGRDGASLVFPCVTILINLINHDRVNPDDGIFSLNRK